MHFNSINTIAQYNDDGLKNLYHQQRVYNLAEDLY